MDTPPMKARRLGHFGALAAIVAVLVACFLVRGPRDRLWGDEPTYLAMATSLARDGDMRYSEADREWALRRSPGGLILQRTESDEASVLSYSKPIVYPVLAAPFVRVLGEGGMLAINFVLLATALWIAWGSLSRLGSRRATVAVGLLFLCGSPILPYLFWGMSETTQVAVSVAGLALSCRGLPRGKGADERAPSSLRPILWGGLCLGLLVALRLPNALVALAPVAAWLAYKRFRIAVVLAVSIALSFGATTALTIALTGSSNPYRALRTSFDERTGYPEITAMGTASPPSTAKPSADGAAGAQGREDRFESSPATHRAYWQLIPEWSRAAYAALYSLVGRHTGLLVYFPALFALGIALWPADRLRFCLFASAIGLLAFYVLWLPGNYFGGSTFIGNRYWLAAYPLVLIGLRKPPPRWAVGIATMLALVIAGSATLGWAEASRAGTLESQAHTRRGIFTRLPAESSADSIDGWEARRWSGDILRFTAPHASIEQSGFRLDGGRTTELFLIRSRTEEPPLLLFAIRADGDGTLKVADRGGEQVIDLTAGEASVASFAPTAPWRRHTVPDVPTPAIFALQVGFELSSGAEYGTVEIRYLGTGSARDIAYRVRRSNLPESGFAGGIGEGWIGIRNHSNFPWTSGGVLPVQLRYTLHPIDGGEPLLGAPIELPATIPPEGMLRTPIRITWPDKPGRYELVLDLETPLFGPFENQVGTPIASQRVTVGEP